jgi:putative hydrolase of the HAD superfamily
VRLVEFDALSFDCYGTLIDWEAGIAAVLNPWAKARGLRLDDEQLLTAYAFHEAAAEDQYPTEGYRRILARSMRGLGDEFGVEGRDADTAALANSVPDWPPFADSHDALVSLGRHFQLMILSNVDRASFAASNVRLGVPFAAVLTAEDIGGYKPSVVNFEKLILEARRLGVGEGKLLHVAQSLFHDHVPAKRVGLPTVWINRRHNRPGWGATPPPVTPVSPDWEFPSMAAFAAAVEAD